MSRSVEQDGIHAAVEALVEGSSDALKALFEAHRDMTLDDAYAAILRIVLRSMTRLVAEARGMTPAHDGRNKQRRPLHDLLEHLDAKARSEAGIHELQAGREAWRIWMAIFKTDRSNRTVANASVRAREQVLFQPGDERSQEPKLRALAALERQRNGPNDAQVLGLLKLLAEMAAGNQGRPNRTTATSDAAQGDQLSRDSSPTTPEIIGGLYETLLDVQLRRISPDAHGPDQQRPSAFFLARWSGTRKGGGAFYTHPGLAGPTVARTLRPLAYAPVDEVTNERTGRTRVTAWRPKIPEDILALRICDPAMGAGSFLVSALRFLVDALAESLETYDRFKETPQGTICTLRLPDAAGPWGQEVCDMAKDHPQFQRTLRRRLGRRVIETCLFGVDLDPMAVALGSAVLWLELGDPDLAHDELAHNLKIGNSLVGSWLDLYGVERASIATLEPDERDHLKKTLDADCAVWFQPQKKGRHARTHAIFDLSSDETGTTAQHLADRHRFFHWELEFPDVFARDNPGFDAVLGNPPWETVQPDSKEFFSKIDPLYRTYGKQRALQRQIELFAEDPSVQQAWMRHSADIEAMARWAKRSGASQTRARRHLAPRVPSNENHPFCHQGSGKPYTYKMFLEQAHAIVRNTGRIGVIVPSGLYTDRGSAPLRRLFLETCRWEWLFGFENRSRIFDIHRSFKFCPIVVEKGDHTAAIQATFMRRDPDDWRNAETLAVPYPTQRIEQFSPRTKSIVEVSDPRDLEVLDRIYRGGVLLGDASSNGWGLTYRQGDFNMTSDSRLFPPRPAWEQRGFLPDEYGHWLKGPWRPIHESGFVLGAKDFLISSNGVDGRNAHGQLGHWTIQNRPDGLVLSRDGSMGLLAEDIEDLALPLYEGRMLGQFDSSAKAWMRGKGRRAVWTDKPFEDRSLDPQYLMARSTYEAHRNGGAARGLKVGFLAVGSATNQRSMIAATTYDAPHGNSVPVIQTTGEVADSLALTAILNSFAYDFTLRSRLGGTNLNYHIIEETPILSALSATVREVIPTIAALAARLSWPSPSFAPAWLALPGRRGQPWRSLWAITNHERIRIRAMLDALVAHLYGLDFEDLAWILRDCDLPMATSMDHTMTRTLAPKGFWRLDKTRPPHLRHTILSLVALCDLNQMGLWAFLSANHGEGWMLPETIRMADYGLGRDAAARSHLPVAAALGPRLTPWQTAQDTDESWQECARHAQTIAQILPLPDIGMDGKRTST